MRKTFLLLILTVILFIPCISANAEDSNKIKSSSDQQKNDLENFLKKEGFKKDVASKKIKGKSYPVEVLYPNLCLVSSVNLMYSYDAISRLTGIIQNNTNYNWAGAGFTVMLLDKDFNIISGSQGGTNSSHIGTSRSSYFMVEFLLTPADFEKVVKILIVKIEAIPDSNQLY